mmetsp:Transcript_4057/g.9617  ORF Transcript_4057/g.9617 Transcript_4057/m.9617 type:complete len:1190 (-) Transcript_4057:72-3641(-)
MSLFGSSPVMQMATMSAPLVPGVQSVGGLFDDLSLSVGAEVEVPDIFLASKEPANTLQQLKGPAPIIRTPQDDNIQPVQGDDTTAPNAVIPSRLNHIVCVSSANVGFSETAKDKNMPPSGLSYEAVVEEVLGSGAYGLTLKMTLEYENPFPKEGMVVWLKKHQQVICDDLKSELMLVETVFQDYVRGQWETITTDIRYAEEAEAVVQAVITTDSSQTAGRVKQEGCVEDAKLGPVGEKGRIVLTYRCSQLYSYAEMKLGTNSSGQRTLVPVAFQLPWSSLDNPANDCSVHVDVSAPAGTQLLCPQTNILAYRDFQRSLHTLGSQAVILPSPAQGSSSDAPSWSFDRSALPPKPTMVLAWLSIPEVDDGWEQLDDDFAAMKVAQTQATILKPSGLDASLLSTKLPGQQDAHLVRCMVTTEAPPRPPNSVRVHTDITISDASGSTGMRRGNVTDTVRAGFNKYEEQRLLRRLEAIPKLVEAGVLTNSDVWNQIWVIFDHGVKQEFGLRTEVKDLDTQTVRQLLQVLRSSDGVAEGALNQAGKSSLLQNWKQALKKLQSIHPGGATSFVAGTDRAKQLYLQDVTKRSSGQDNIRRTTYVNFDTDGGNNCGPCYKAIAALTKEADVVQGHVTGIGAWVDQDCATKVAKLLKGSTSLSLQFPSLEEADAVFRQDLSRWGKTLRSCPIEVKVSAGSLAWTARHGSRNENGVDVLMAKGDGVTFGQPDVSEQTYTKSVMKGVQAGETISLYMLSRWPLEQLAATLRVEVEGVQARIATRTDPMRGVTLGHHWISNLGGPGEGVAVNKSVLCTRLRQRLEDDMSFAWNLPTKSGSTAAVGRAKTEQRPPVPAEKQPVEPEVISLAPKVEPIVGFGGGTFFGGRCGGPPRVRCAAAAAPTLGVNAFGAAGGGGCGFGGGNGGGGGGGGLFGSASAGPPPALPQAAMGLMHPMMAAPPPSNSNFSMAPAAASNSLGLSVSKESASLCRSKKKKLPQSSRTPINPWGHDEDDDDDAVNCKVTPATPSELLRASGFMRIGAEEEPVAAAKRSLQALQYLAQQATLLPTQPPRGHVFNEDPLVADLLGTKPANNQAGVVHMGFVCDATNQNPITGVRYKATNQKDMDITHAARVEGKFPMGGSGWKAIADPAIALRQNLAGVLCWWQVMWPHRGDLFGQPFPDLRTLSLHDLVTAVQKLPVP